MNGDMTYLGQNIEKRIDPGKLFPGAKSVIVTGLNYFSGKKQGGKGMPVISQYAYGRNYHVVIKGRLNKLLSYIRTLNPDVAGKVFVDTAPILEKAWAREAGLGLPGKHSVLINTKLGTFFFLGIIVINAELDYDKPASADYCGSCSLCRDACPTGAINDNRTINTPKCIAYLTLESKSDIPEDLVGKLDGRAFGCDICQDACPWNSKAKPHSVPEFDLPDEVLNMSADDWKNLTRKDFKRLFKESAIGRRSYCRFMDAINAVTQ
jgi:epoxyqueuosine reductase